MFHKESDAEQAMCYLDGCQIDGGVVKVSYVLVSANRRSRDLPAEKDVSAVRRSRSRERGPATGNASRRTDRSPARDNRRGSAPPAGLVSFLYIFLSFYVCSRCSLWSW